MTTYPAPNPPFIQARYQGGSQRPKALVIHGTVTSDNAGTARNIAHWWAGPNSPKSSCHYIVDPREVIQCVGDHRVAWHCGSNQDCIGIELCDEQSGSARRWDDADSQAIIKRAAKLAAQLCLAYGIEVKRPSISALKSKGKHGIYGHNDSRLAFGGTTHVDPKDFPWAKFIALVQSEKEAIVRAATGVKPPSTPKSTSLFKHMQASMQYSDTDKQHASDAEKVFAYGAAVITGTEAGPGAGNLSPELKKAAEKYGYYLKDQSGSWVAIKKSVGKLIATGHIPVLPGVRHQYGARGITWMKVYVPYVGNVVVGSVHYVTKGRKPGDPRWNQNQKLRFAVKAFGEKYGAGETLVFVGSDTNMLDSGKIDTVPGFQTCWDALGKHPKTHPTAGNVDVVARYKGDTRSKFTAARVLGDSTFFLNTDHAAVVATIEVKRKASR